MIAMPIAPHRVEVRTVMRKFADFGEPAGRAGAHRRLVVAGDRALGRGQRHLDVLGRAGGELRQLLGSKLDFQPSGVVADNSTSRAASLPSLRRTTVSWLSCPPGRGSRRSPSGRPSGEYHASSDTGSSVASVCLGD